MTFDLTAPPRTRIPFTRDFEEHVTFVLFEIFDAIAGAHDVEPSEDSQREFHYVHEGSWLNFSVQVVNYDLTVTYSHMFLGTLMGTVAIRLGYLLNADVSLGAHRFTCTIPYHTVLPYDELGECPPADKADPTLDVVADRTLGELVSTLIDDHRKSDDRHHWVEARPTWTDPLQGEVELWCRVGATDHRLPDDDSSQPPTRRVGSVVLRLHKGGIDLLPEMCDLPAFARRFNLHLVQQNSLGDWVFVYDAGPLRN